MHQCLRSSLALPTVFALSVILLSCSSDVGLLPSEHIRIAQEPAASAPVIEHPGGTFASNSELEDLRGVHVIQGDLLIGVGLSDVQGDVLTAAGVSDLSALSSIAEIRGNLTVSAHVDPARRRENPPSSMMGSSRGKARSHHGGEVGHSGEERVAVARRRQGVAQG